jgi:hypothetical protein
MYSVLERDKISQQGRRNTTPGINKEEAHNYSY